MDTLVAHCGSCQLAGGAVASALVKQHHQTTRMYVMISQYGWLHIVAFISSAPVQYSLMLPSTVHFSVWFMHGLIDQLPWLWHLTCGTRQLLVAHLQPLHRLINCFFVFGFLSGVTFVNVCSGSVLHCSPWLADCMSNKVLRQAVVTILQIDDRTASPGHGD